MELVTPIITRIFLTKIDTKNGSLCILDMIKPNQRPTLMLNGLMDQINKPTITLIITSPQNSMCLSEEINSSPDIVEKWLLLNLILVLELILKTINLPKLQRMSLVSIRDLITYSRKMTRLNLDKLLKMFFLIVSSRRSLLLRRNLKVKRILRNMDMDSGLDS